MKSLDPEIAGRYGDDMFSHHRSDERQRLGDIALSFDEMSFPTSTSYRSGTGGDAWM